MDKKWHLSKTWKTKKQTNKQSVKETFAKRKKIFNSIGMFNGEVQVVWMEFRKLEKIYYS